MTYNTEIVTNKYFRNYKRCTNALCVHHVMSPLCFANAEIHRAQRCHVHHVTFVQSLFAKSWTKLDMSPKCVCPFSTKTAENNWKKILCAVKAWLIVVTWRQKVQMTKNWTYHLCALNSQYVGVKERKADTEKDKRGAHTDEIAHWNCA